MSTLQPKNPQPARAIEDRASFASIWRLTWPQMLMMSANFFSGFIDVFVAGKIGREVQASLGIITQSLMFFLIFAMAVANGSVAAISQSLGANLHQRARRYINLSLALAVLFSAIILALGFFLRDIFLILLRVPDSIVPVTSYFLRVYLLVLPPYYLLIVTNALFRARKDVRIPLYAMVLVTVVNTIGDFGLGLGWFGLPALGYPGVAWSTFFSVSAGAAFNILMLARKGLLSLSCLPLRWVKKAWPYLFKVAWPSGGMSLVWQTGYLALFAVVASLPTGALDALAGMTAGARVESARCRPGFAFNRPASLLVGHYMGAGRPREAKRVGALVLMLGVGLISTMALVAWFFIEPITANLSPEPGVQGQMIQYLIYNFIATPFTVGSMILGGVMIGAGATIYNLCIFGASTWLVRLPIAYVLGHVVWGDALGVWVAMLVSQVFQCLTMLYFFLFSNWSRHGMRRSRRTPALS